MPKLWKDTVEEHRRDVRAAVIDAAWQLASELGVLGVTMGAIAEGAGIGRATLYKYFGGVEEILIAGHAAHVADHMRHLDAVRASATSPQDALHRVLGGYARIALHRAQAKAPELDEMVHVGVDHRDAQASLCNLFVDVIGESQTAGEVRTDMATAELATYCLHALSAAVDVTSHAALDRLVALVEASLRDADR